MSDVNERWSLQPVFFAISECQLNQSMYINKLVRDWIKGDLDGMELVHEVVMAKAALDHLHRNIIMQERGEAAAEKADAEAVGG